MHKPILSLLKCCSLAIPASSISVLSSCPGTYCASSSRSELPPAVPLPLLATSSSPRSGKKGRVAGVAYRMLTVQVPFAASGDTVVQVCAVMLYRPPKFSASVSAVIVSGPPPVLVTVTTLVTAARDAGIVNLSVGKPSAVASVPLVALVKLSVPTAVPVPLSATGEPVTVTPAPYATVSVRSYVVVAADGGAKSTLIVHDAPALSVAPQFGAPVGNVPVVTRANGCGVPPPNVKEPPVALVVQPLWIVTFCVALVVPSL